MAEKLIAEGVDEKTAREAARLAYSTEQRTLLPPHRLYIDNPDGLPVEDNAEAPAERVITVADILRNPGAFEKETMADPLTPDQRNKAFVMIGKIYGDPMIRSLAHGGITYALKWDYESILAEISKIDKDKLNERRLVVSKVVSMLTIGADGGKPLLDAGEEESLLKEAKQVSNIGLGVFKKDLAEARKEREAKKKAAQAEQRQAAVEARSGGRPTITLEPGRIKEIADKAVDALNASASCDLYQQGGRIVRPEFTKAIDHAGNEIEVPGVVAVEDDALWEYLNTAARFVRVDDQGKPTVVDAPKTLVGVLKARRGRAKLPVLRGLISTPIVLADGRVIDKPGYDEQSGLIYDPRGAQFPPVPEAPTLADAKAAIATLSKPISEYPFADKKGVSRSVVLSGVMSAVLRMALPTAPAHAITATTAGSGKTKLAELASVVATGKRPSMLSQGSTVEEFEKRLAASMLDGHSILVIDNCEAAVEGPLINQLLTSTMCCVRVFGTLTNVHVSNIFLAFLTGNNLVIAGDMVRRVVRAVIDAKVDRPEQRPFDFDPVEYAEEHRAELVIAVLTIVRAFQLATDAKPAPVLGGFELWSNMIRSALVWAGEADPCESMEEVRKEDPVLGRLRETLERWDAAVGDSKLTASELVEALKEDLSYGHSSVPPTPKQEFYKFLVEQFPQRGGGVNTKTLGNYLKSIKGRPVEGRAIVPAGTAGGGVTRWTLEGACCGHDDILNADPAPTSRPAWDDSVPF